MAAGLSGSGRYRYGGVRDFLIGVRFVDGQGRLVRGGGKVVKNVAGYDTHKLQLGALGTLGVIAEATFKVAPLPAQLVTLGFACADGPAALALASLLRARPLAPVSLQSPALPTGSTLRRVAVSAVQLGDDLPRGHHRVKVRVMSPGRYWARFWVQGKKPVTEAAESFVSADPADQVEVEQ